MRRRSNDFDEARLALRMVLTGQLFLVAWGVAQAAVAPALTGFPYGRASWP
ncbi:MAG TPA: hypothetical protein VD886_08955 [Herpetosiphonaceae bacterium]|nr:hypothetical protein [Herpetosiphonaceae bacterium]